MQLLADAFDFHAFLLNAGAWLQNLSSASSVAETIFIVLTAIVGFVRFRSSRKDNGHRLTGTPDARVLAIAENLADLPAAEQMRSFIHAQAAIVGEMSEQCRSIAETAGRERRASEAREKKLLARIDELEARVDFLLAAADEYTGREMAYVSRIEDLEKQVRAHEPDAAALTEARARIDALEQRLAEAHVRADTAVEEALNAA